MFCCTVGAAYASAPAGIFVIRSASNSLKSFGPIVIAGVLALYGFIISGILASKLTKNATPLTERDGYINLAAGLAVGLACLASGMGMSKFIEQSLLHSGNSTTGETNASIEHPLLPQGNNRARNNNIGSIPPEFTVRYFFVMVYLEAIGLYGLIIALFLTASQK
jgi:ATP synthase proteolipid subunit